jgi:fumarate reductase flavoprotein subunit
MTQTRGEFDVLVIGAGGCGMVAALVAAQHGARVALLEKTDKPGGGTAFSSKGLRAAGTRFQQAQAVADSGEQYARDIRERNSGQSDPELTLRLARSTSEVVHWLADTAGIEFEVPEFMFGHSARRSHSWKADRKITDFLFEALQRDKHIETFFSVTASSFVVDAGGAVTGVSTDKGVFNARKTILATGGFGASAELVAKYIPKAAGIPFPGHHGSTGDGLHMALDLGAEPAHMDAFQPYPAYLGPGKRSVTPEVIMSGGIMVGPDGRRFGNETRYPGGLSAGILDLPDKQGYEVFDQRIYDLQRHQLGDVERDFVKGDTAAELAGKLGIEAGGLEQSVQSYNQAVGTSDTFGRSVSSKLAPPFYGVKVTVALYHTQGGIRVNPEGEVLRKDGSVIPNLYAGGGVAAGVSGDGMEGYLPGNGQLASLGLGFIAGKNAALSLGERTGSR